MKGLTKSQVCFSGSQEGQLCRSFIFDTDDLAAVVAESSRHKCACCWKYLLDVGTHDGHPTRCGVGKVNMPRLNAVLLTFGNHLWRTTLKSSAKLRPRHGKIP